MDIEIPSVEFMLVSYGAAAILLPLIALMMKVTFRVGGAASWIMLMAFGPLPVLAAVPLASIAQLSPFAAVPAVSMAVLVGLLWVHIVLPALVPDFQTASFSGTMIASMILGISVLIGGAVTNSFPEGYLLGSTDQRSVFTERTSDIGTWADPNE